MRREGECLRIVLCTIMGQWECVKHCRVSQLLDTEVVRSGLFKLRIPWQDPCILDAV